MCRRPHKVGFVLHLSTQPRKCVLLYDEQTGWGNVEESLGWAFTHTFFLFVEGFQPPWWVTPKRAKVVKKKLGLLPSALLLLHLPLLVLSFFWGMGMYSVGARDLAQVEEVKLYAQTHPLRLLLSEGWYTVWQWSRSLIWFYLKVVVFFTFSNLLL